MPVGTLSRFFGTSTTGARSVSGTANRVAVYDADGKLAASDVTVTELDTLIGIIDDIQDQLDALSSLDDGEIFVGDATNTSVGVTPTGDVTISNTGVMAIAPAAIIDADVNAAAAIARTKLAAGTASRVNVTDGSGNITDSDITTTELDHLDDALGETTTVLNDAQGAPATILTYSKTFEYSVIEYGIERGAGNRESGRLLITTDGTLVEIAQDSTLLGAMGVTITASISGGDVLVQYISTSTGTAPTIKLTQRKWGA